MIKLRFGLVSAASAALLVTACDDAGQAEQAATPITNSATNDAGLGAAVDGVWTNVSGKVVSTTPSSFILDHGGTRLTVEMDDWDWYQEGRVLNPGDEVVVTGRVDRDLFRTKAIEASSVYVKNLGTYFYASGADEEELLASAAYVSSAPSYVDFTGIVSAIEGREFTVDAEGGPLRVDTSMLPRNPLDAEGFQQVKVGQRVYVWGDLDLEKAENPELKAKGIVILTKDATKQK